MPSPLVLGRTYKKVARELSKHFHVTMLELPGSGREPGKWRIWSATSYSFWLLLRLNELKIRKPFIIGHSNSGNVGIQFAAENPSRLQGLILADSTGFQPQSYFKIFFYRILDAFREWRFSLAGFFHLAFNLFFHLFNFLAQTRAAIKADLSNELQRVETPTLVLWGRKDRTVPISHAWGFKNNMPNATLRFCNKGSHDWIITHSKEFAAAVKDFIELSQRKAKSPSPT